MSFMNRTKDVFNKIIEFSRKHPLVRGMASYAIIWPIGSVIQQTVEGREKYDYARIARFSFYGSCYVAPTLNLWLRTAYHMWPKPDLASSLAKALVEQICYTPFAMVSFYFGMTLLEGRSLRAAREEVADKFWPTYKVGAVVWPVLQTINYTLISEKNRITFVSVCSLMWTSFLAYMKHLEGTHFKEHHPAPTHLEKKL